MPNPLDRPRAVLMLEIKGEHGICSTFENKIENIILVCMFSKGVNIIFSLLIHVGPEIVNLKSGISSNVLTSKVHVGSESADIQLPGTFFFQNHYWVNIFSFPLVPF